MANRELSVKELFGHFKGRRAGIIRALTTDAKIFYQQCDPEYYIYKCKPYVTAKRQVERGFEYSQARLGLTGDLKSARAMYGTWELRLPEEMVPPDLPEPMLGVNYGKAETSLDQWLRTVAAHSDSWLIALAFSIASNFHFGEKKRKMLFNKINDLPTVLEAVKQFYRERQATIRSNSRTKSRDMMRAQQSQVVAQPQEAHKDEDYIPCGSCGRVCEGDEFWIFCDMCKIWYHGDCVDMTPELAGLIKQYTCPNCSCKRARV